ncbi:hypothetical protein MYAM1_000757 [Malassezia yamatoensis]|uniref:37S ribosomal protein S28, mitochondrial n=1 Tax=Malassezia yamatoensis TaxID=253288 RepID=A0AAJ6CHN9_9BASI|nr:hypothetical protein MYAM1_000757 [Malassezia yamatoensis]
MLRRIAGSLEAGFGLRGHGKLEQIAALHTSATVSESKQRRAARLRRNANLQRREIMERLFQLSKPDPVLAHQLNDEGYAYWNNSELAKIILSKEEVWGFAEDRRGQLIEYQGRERPEDAQVDAEASAYGGPRRLNFGLSVEDRRTLFQSLPRVMTEDRVLDAASVHLGHDQSAEVLASEHAQSEAEQQQSADTLARILDLRNASGKGIQVENTRRIVKHFGARPEGQGYDTGSPEVQAAILTYRIRNLSEHLGSARKDNSNRRAMTHLVHQRAKILRYLKSRDPIRYQAFLPRIGVEARAVEGEVVVPGMPKVKRI